MTEISMVGDWGSTRLRLWRLEEGQVTDRQEGLGVIGLQQTPADVLLEAIAPWRAADASRVTLCGMAGCSEICFSPVPRRSMRGSRPNGHRPFFPAF